MTHITKSKNTSEASKSIIIPEGVTYIEKNACISNKNIEKIFIPESVEYIGEHAFDCCKNLKQVVFEKNSHLKEIREFAFSNCESLKEIELPNSLVEIKSFAFYNTKIEKLHIPQNTMIIQPAAFSSIYNSLKEITVSKNNERFSDMNCNIIYDRTFNDIIQGCSNSKLPANIYTIDECAFLCTELKSKNINLESLKYLKFICRNSFAKANINSNELTLPPNITIFPKAFTEIDSLESLTIQHKTSIDDEVFENCCNLKNIFIYNNKGLVNISEDAFKGTSEELKIYVANMENLNKAFKIAYADKIIPLTLDILIEQGNSIKEINKFYKNNKIQKEQTNEQNR